MGKIISVMGSDRKRPLEWFDVLEESFGIGENETELDNEEKSESDLPDQKDEEYCFYCNRLLTNDQGIFDIFEHKRCVECNCEAIKSEEEAKSIVDSCLYVLKYVNEMVPWERSSIKLKEVKLKKLVSIKVAKLNIGHSKKKERLKKKKDKVKRKERKKAKKKEKEEAGKKKALGLIYVYIKKGIPRLKLITEIFEWYFGKIQELERREVQQRVVKCLSEMGELSYATRYGAYFQKNGNTSTKSSEDTQNPLSDVESKFAEKIGGTKENLGTEIINISENKNHNIIK